MRANAKYLDGLVGGGRRKGDACSFTGSTVVLMADGSKKPIEDIKVGDKVIATDPETGEQAAKTVQHVWVHHDTVTDLIVDGEVITTTEDHPFWSVTDQRFERADQLIEGEQVLSAGGRTVTVSGLELRTTRDDLAYNLTVEDIHTYHVGQNEILVHNICPTRPKREDGISRLSNAQATDLAKYLGYSKTNYRSHGQPVFRSGSKYITQDIDGHVGGTWKMATSPDGFGPKQRLGTYDHELNWMAP